MTVFPHALRQPYSKAPFYPSPIQPNLGTPDVFKGLGQNGTGRNDLANWYQHEFYPYYQKVIRGEVQISDPGQWQEVLQSARWAYQQLFGTSGFDGQGSPGPSFGDFNGNLGGDASAASTPEGAVSGLDDNWVFNGEKADLEFTGETRPSDSWAEQNTLRVASRSAKIQYELTLDSRANPPRQILKVVVTDEALAQESIYLFHTWDDPNFQLNLQVPNKAQVFATNPLSSVKVGDYSSQPTVSLAETELSGEEIGENEWLYETENGETLLINSKDNTAETEEHRHWLYADSININTRFTDEVSISKGNPENSDGLTVIVKHRKGSVDVYYIPSGSNLNLNARWQNLTWGQGTMGEFKQVPAEFEDLVNIGQSPSAVEKIPNSNGDSVPDSTENSTARYNKSTNVNIHADFSDEIQTHEIYAPGLVQIHGEDFSDTMEVAYNPGTRTWIIQVFRAGDPTKVEQFIVKGGSDTKVILDALGEQSIQFADEAAKQSVTIGANPEINSPGVASEPAQKLSELFGHDPSAQDIEEKAKEENFAFDLNYPPTPNEKIFQFLYEIDPVLHGLLDDCLNGGRKDLLGIQVRDRLVILLQILYPRAGVQAVEGEDWYDKDNILFARSKVDVFVQAIDAENPWDYLRFGEEVGKESGDDELPSGRILG